MRAPLVAAALALATPASADVLGFEYRPGYAWYHAPDTTQIGDGRVRMVFAGDRAAVLTPNQFWFYERAYSDALARLSFSMPVAQAEPRARAAALAAIARAYPELTVGGVAIEDLDGPRLWPRLPF